MTQITKEAIENLKAVLCDPEGTVCIRGSDRDREIIQESLESLRATNTEVVEALLSAKEVVDAAFMSDDLDGSPSDDQDVLISIRAKIDSALKSCGAEMSSRDAQTVARKGAGGGAEVAIRFHHHIYPPEIFAFIPPTDLVSNNDCCEAVMKSYRMGQSSPAMPSREEVAALIEEKYNLLDMSGMPAADAVLDLIKSKQERG